MYMIKHYESRMNKNKISKKSPKAVQSKNVIHSFNPGPMQYKALVYKTLPL